MSGVRQSMLFSLEDVFGEGKGTRYSWIAPPPGSWLTTTHNRNTTRVNTQGCKTYDAIAYGSLSGSFEWNFSMSYDYLEPLYLMFESYGAYTEVDGAMSNVEGATGDGTTTDQIGRASCRERV